MPAPAIRYDGHAIDLSGRFFNTTTVTGSPQAATETIIATLTLSENVSMQKAVYLFFECAFTAGTNGTGATLKLRQTDASGSTLWSSGAVTVVATKLYSPTAFAVDTAGTIPGQVYVATLTIANGSAESTVSAVNLIGVVV